MSILIYIVIILAVTIPNVATWYNLVPLSMCIVEREYRPRLPLHVIIEVIAVWALMESVPFSQWLLTLID